MKTQTNTNCGVGFINLLAILFICLKLTNYIEWSWWLVLMPLWAPVALYIAMVALIAMFVKVTK